MTKFLFDQSNRNIDALVINDPTDVIVKRFLLECEKLILMFSGLNLNRFLFFLPFRFPTCCSRSKIYGAYKFSYLDFLNIRSRNAKRNQMIKLDVAVEKTQPQ